MRKQVSKSLRFEIFTRDAYTCQYCGRKPPDVILHIDHRVPVSKGGDNDPMNLITGCQDCNLGKASRLPGECNPTPDSEIERLKLTQERLEFEEYLREKTERDDALDEAMDLILEMWQDGVTQSVPAGSTFYVPKRSHLQTWLRIAGVKATLEAMESMQGYLSTGWIRSSTSTECFDAIKYFYGILRRLRGPDATR